MAKIHCASKIANNFTSSIILVFCKNKIRASMIIKISFAEYSTKWVLTKFMIECKRVSKILYYVILLNKFLPYRTYLILLTQFWYIRLFFESIEQSSKYSPKINCLNIQFTFLFIWIFLKTNFLEFDRLKWSGIGIFTQLFQFFTEFK